MDKIKLALLISSILFNTHTSIASFHGPAFYNDIAPHNIFSKLSHADLDSYAQVCKAFLKGSELVYANKLLLEFAEKINMSDSNELERPARDRYLSFYKQVYTKRYENGTLLIKAGNLDSHDKRSSFLNFLSLNRSICTQVLNLDLVPSAEHTQYFYLNDWEFSSLELILAQSPNIRFLTFGDAIYDESGLNNLINLINNITFLNFVTIKVRSDNKNYLTSFNTNLNVIYTSN